MMAIPLLVIVPSTQSLTNSVKSTGTNWFCTGTTPAVSIWISAGAVAHVTVRSLHAPPTEATSNVPL